MLPRSFAQDSALAARPLWKRLPWLDYAGRVSPLKAAVFIALFIPGLVTLYWFEADMLGGRALIEVNHEMGLWGIRLLAIALAMTPFRQVFRQPKVALIRRMIGVAAFCYLAIHFSFYVADQKFDLGTVASEIVRRFYLTIGFVALLIMLALAVTSTDGMQKRLKRRWQTLHRLVYLAAIIGTVHYFIQVKLNVFEPTWFAGVIGWLLLYRLMAHWLGVERASSFPALLALSIAVGVLTAVGEYGYYATFTGVRAGRVWQANFTLAAGLRPGWIAMALGLAFTLLATLWKIFDKWRMPHSDSSGRLAPARRAAR
jgi:methionine sulfoxide reductase heme-binding subunit